jgi:hypothetical protein
MLAYLSTDAAKHLRFDNFMYWTLYLYHMVQHSKKDVVRDENVTIYSPVIRLSSLGSFREERIYLRI